MIAPDCLSQRLIQFLYLHLTIGGTSLLRDRLDFDELDASTTVQSWVVLLSILIVARFTVSLVGNNLPDLP